MVIEDAYERRYMEDKYFDIPLGYQIIRGDEICLLGEVDPEDIKKPIPGLQYTTMEQLNEDLANAEQNAPQEVVEGESNECVSESQVHHPSE